MEKNDKKPVEEPLTIVEDLRIKMKGVVVHLENVDNKVQEYKVALNKLGKSRIALQSKYNTLSELLEQYTKQEEERNET